MTQTLTATQPAAPFSDVTFESHDLSWLDFLQDLQRLDPRAMQAVLMCLAMKTLDGERVHVVLPDRSALQAWKNEPARQLILPSVLKRKEGDLSGALVLAYEHDARQWLASIHT